MIEIKWRIYVKGVPEINKKENKQRKGSEPRV